MRIDVRIIAPDLVEVTMRWSWWLERLLRIGLPDASLRIERLETMGWAWEGTYCRPSRRITAAISRAFADLDARRAAETARNYQAAAQRGEYPIR